jgi:PleD family two-component response regulator
VTVSIGGAILCSGEPSGSWLQRADQCLYQAKSAGRNRSIIDEAQQSVNQQPVGKR